MHNMGKTIGELHALLIEYAKAKGRGKKKGKAKNDACHHCKKVGQRKRNCPVYLAELMKKKKQVGTASSSGLRGARKLEQRALYLYVGNGLTPSYTPQHNGVSERRNHTLLNMVRSMMNLTTLSLSFWDYARESVARILNMVLAKKVDKTPYELCGRAGELKEIEYEHTSPSENTSKIPMEVEGFEPPHEEEAHIQMQSMKDNQVWRLVDLLPDCKTVRSRWLFKKKADMGGNVHIYNAHLVAKGFTQFYEVDYKEMFSPVTDIRVIRILIAIAAYYEYEIWQIDVKTAFLNGYLDEDIYMAKHMQNVPYALAVGSIMYAVRCTRPNVAFAQNITSRFQHNPGEPHWTAVKTILKYLRNTKDMFLVHGENPEAEPRVDCYCDARFETDRDDTKSQTKAEYIDASEATMEAVWIMKFISGLALILAILREVTTGLMLRYCYCLVNIFALTKKHSTSSQSDYEKIDKEIRLNVEAASVGSSDMDERNGGFGFAHAKEMYVVPTGRVIILTGRYVVPTGRVIVATGRDIWNVVKARGIAQRVSDAGDAGEFALMSVTFETKLDNHLVQTEKWRNSSKNLFKLIDSSMFVRTKVGLGFTDCISENELGWDDSAFSVFATNSEDAKGRPIFHRFAKTVSMKVVPPPLTRDYTSLSDHTDLDESQMSYGTKSSTSCDSKSVSNDFVSCVDSDKSSEVNTNDFAFSDSSVKSLEHKPTDSNSCVSTSSVSTSVNEAEIESNVGTPIKEPVIVQDLPSFPCNSFDKTEHTFRTSCNKNGYFNKKAGHFRKNASSVSKLCFVYGSGTHLIKDCDFYEKQIANTTVGLGMGPAVRPQPVPTGKPKVNPVPTGKPKVKPVPTGKPKVTPVPTGKPKVTPVSTGKPTVTPVPTGKLQVSTPVPTGRPNRPFLVPTDRVYSPSVISSPQQVVLGNHIEKVYTGYPRTIVDLIYLHTDDNVADLLTKALDGPRVFNSPILHLLRVEMVINSLWIMTILGIQELASPKANGFCPEQTATGKDISNPFMAVMICQKSLGYSYSPMIHVLRVGLVINLPGYVVPTGRVIIPSGRYVVPTGRVIVATGRYIVPAGNAL
uniref:Retrotransposon protein, putative, Ty1-copia subclass n=1 Tax=Tanacetum cinerariifolium TaxID=118510 RepID=A0A6L2NN60_TANCI|nr:retrotransposon protein, putative, Ty1-copia subclass [Tanacetum cinerariifolium]